MDDGIALALDVPSLFFSNLLHPSASGGLFLVTAAATACLVGGSIFGVIRRKTVLLYFLIPIALSELLLVLVSLPDARDWAAGGWGLIGFLIFQAGLCGHLIWRARGARLAATSLAIFNLVYAACAALGALLEVAY